MPLQPKDPEQGYKVCASLMKLESRYSAERLENACKRVLEFNSTPSIRNISSILKSGQDRLPIQKDEPTPSEPNSYGMLRSMKMGEMAAELENS